MANVATCPTCAALGGLDFELFEPDPKVAYREEKTKEECCTAAGTCAEPLSGLCLSCKPDWTLEANSPILTETTVK